LVRLYWSFDLVQLPPLVKRLTGLLSDDARPWMLKCAADPAVHARADAVVLYLARPALEERASAIDSIATEFAAHAGALRPPLTLALHPGLSLAVDPANGESFGQHRCRLLAEAFLAAPNDNDDTVLAQIADRMARDGIAPTRPYAGGDDPPFPWEA
jgi:hypothetical protein